MGIRSRLSEEKRDLITEEGGVRVCDAVSPHFPRGTRENYLKVGNNGWTPSDLDVFPDEIRRSRGSSRLENTHKLPTDNWFTRCRTFKCAGSELSMFQPTL